MIRKNIVLLVLLLSIFCCKTHKQSPSLKPFEVTIDWIPSPEYYGFFYAKRNRLYEKAGLEVTIRSGTGAPTVATQIALGSIYAGTTTSDNIVRTLARGGEMSRAIPLLSYNPSVIAVLPTSPIRSLPEIQGKMIGVNRQSSPYQQLMWLARHGKLGNGRFQEYPIGYGGAVQLKTHEVDAILAYTTNVVVDLQKDGIDARELSFGDAGVKLYGTVLAIASKTDLAHAGITAEDVNAFIKATLEGYDDGSHDIAGAIDSLMEAQPTLDRQKLDIAIRKIVQLRKGLPYPLSELDSWVEADGLNDQIRQRVRELYH